MISPIALIPRPASVNPTTGHFRLDGSVPLVAASPAAHAAAESFRDLFYRLSGLRLIAAADSAGPSITLIDNGHLDPEAYVLQVTPAGVLIQASNLGGFFYALQTLLQCIPLESAADPNTPAWDIPCLEIKDAPRFAWRGLMLDSSRHFHPVAWVKKFIDVMALHKFNVLHWHLVDDQGWRVEIKKYTALTAVSAWRHQTRTGHENNGTDSDFDGRPHGGFYSQDELRSLVAYAQNRGVTIVPEIEMPGHAQAVLAAFPHLACTDGPFEVSQRWGIHEEAFCAGNDAVLRFLEDVLVEVMAIFPAHSNRSAISMGAQPSNFIHVGGDECRKTRWKACPKCQARIRDEGLADEDELQSWFIRHFDAFLTARGRRLIGWDEILEGGLAQNAAVMSWRGEEAGIEAATAGHDVVMAPNQKTYLDYYQSEDKTAEPLAIGGFLPLQKLYEFNPIPEGLAPDKAHHILGAQSQLWTEYMPTTGSVEYMAFPRATALSERLWSGPESGDYEDFLRRLKPHLRLLDRLGVKYRQPS